MAFLLNISIAFLVLCTTVYCAFPGCPFEAEIIKPCTCKYSEIFCGGNATLDLVHIFQTLDKNLTKTQKHFKSFNLNNTFITELKENTFKDITFDAIFIESCRNLTKIDVNAFVQTDLVTKQLKITFNNKLSSPDNSIFEVFSKFINLEILQVWSANITEIPSNAFKRTVGDQDKLNYIEFRGESIKKIGERAFSPLTNLTNLRLTYTHIDHIPEYAFEFDQVSNQTFVLEFDGNWRLNSSGFHKNSLTHFKRPTEVDFGWYIDTIHYLDETVFKTFLEKDARNKIKLAQQHLDCKNCKNMWIQKDFNLQKRISYLYCTQRNITINDTANFAKCKPDQDVLKPCIFDKNQNSIVCNGYGDIDLKGIFGKFSKQLNESQKHFKSFYLHHNTIKSIDENVFNDITFDLISIDTNFALERIDVNAFSSTNLVTKELVIRGNSHLSTQNNPKLFDIISRFVKLERLLFNGNPLITDIPSKAFRPLNGYQKNIKILQLWGPFKTLGSNAFSNLKNVTRINLDNTEFNKIADNAFAFDEPSNTTLDIQFWGSPEMKNDAFSEKSLINIKRPTNLHFGDSLQSATQITYLDEKVFLPFLLENKNNTIDLWNDDFNCKDNRNLWLKTHHNLSARFTRMACL